MCTLTVVAEGELLDEKCVKLFSEKCEGFCEELVTVPGEFDDV